MAGCDVVNSHTSKLDTVFAIHQAETTLDFNRCNPLGAYLLGELN